MTTKIHNDVVVALCKFRDNHPKHLFDPKRSFETIVDKSIIKQQTTTIDESKQQQPATSETVVVKFPQEDVEKICNETIVDKSIIKQQTTTIDESKQQQPATSETVVVKFPQEDVEKICKENQKVLKFLQTKYDEIEKQIEQRKAKKQIFNHLLSTLTVNTYPGSDYSTDLADQSITFNSILLKPGFNLIETQTTLTCRSRVIFVVPEIPVELSAVIGINSQLLSKVDSAKFHIQAMNHTDNDITLSIKFKIILCKDSITDEIKNEGLVEKDKGIVSANKKESNGIDWAALSQKFKKTLIGVPKRKLFVPGFSPIVTTPGGMYACKPLWFNSVFGPTDVNCTLASGFSKVAAFDVKSVTAKTDFDSRRGCLNGNYMCGIYDDLKNVFKYTKKCMNCVLAESMRIEKNKRLTDAQKMRAREIIEAQPHRLFKKKKEAAGNTHIDISNALLENGELDKPISEFPVMRMYSEFKFEPCSELSESLNMPITFAEYDELLKRCDMTEIVKKSKDEADENERATSAKRPLEDVVDDENGSKKKVAKI